MKKEPQISEGLVFFSRINRSNIDYYFNQKFSTWLFRSSDEKELLSESGRFIYDSEGNLIEVSYSGTIDGFELTEADFVKKELRSLNEYNYELLSLKNKKQYSFYESYLKNRSRAESKLTVEQTALIMVYEGKTLVTRKEHGNNLYNLVTKWSKRQNRIANDGTDLQLKNKIKRFESILPYLSEEKKLKVIDEVKTLKSYLPEK
jgi:hypothetical protein